MPSKPYNTDAALLETFLERLRKMATDYTYIRKDGHSIHLEEVHDAMLKILFRVHFDSGGQNARQRHGNALLHAITDLTKELNIPLISLT